MFKAFILNNCSLSGLCNTSWNFHPTGLCCFALSCPTSCWRLSLWFAFIIPKLKTSQYFACLVNHFINYFIIILITFVLVSGKCFAPPSDWYYLSSCRLIEFQLFLLTNATCQQQSSTLQAIQIRHLAQGQFAVVKVWTQGKPGWPHRPTSPQLPAFLQARLVCVSLRWAKVKSSYTSGSILLMSCCLWGTQLLLECVTSVSNIYIWCFRHFSNTWNVWDCCLSVAESYLYFLIQ